MEMNKAMELLRGLVSEIERQTCEHAETHRGGAIWEICDSCGAKWADDEGGKPEFEWPESVEKAREFLAAHPTVEQAGGDERDLQGAQGERDGWGPLPIVQVPWNVFDRAVMWVEDRRRYGDDGTIVDDWKALKTIQRAALAQPSQAPDYFAHADKKLEALLNATALILESPGHDAAHYWAKCLREYDEAHAQVAQARHVPELDPLNLAPHAEAFNEAPAEALKPEQAEAEAEAERPEVVARVVHSNPVVLNHCAPLNANDELMTVAQHAASVARWAEMFNRVEQERDAALANVDALAVQVLKLGGTISFAHHRTDQAGQVPQAWLDVQAERRRQVEAEGWTPEHDDAHSHGEMARAAACYALAGSSAPNDGTAALLVSLAWPWDEQWWKPTSARRDLVKACALALAEIERLDRAGISQNPQPGATTASS
ncbi:hypothetical protein [Pseudomonas aeruginosa]|uniref:hypothetical protein n=1 Tax=Pseudomonas aeruginosa TaxID=287 RepID=UPI0027390A78|nr:hypothetical protein [Pseudomonas aeruginosa]